MPELAEFAPLARRFNAGLKLGREPFSTFDVTRENGGPQSGMNCWFARVTASVSSQTSIIACHWAKGFFIEGSHPPG